MQQTREYKRPRVTLLITDLDNTLYDWISSFVPAFYAMVEMASTLLNVSRRELLSELQAVHQQHGTSEQPYALLEIKSVRAAERKIGPDAVRRLLDPAFHTFNKTRKARLRPYEGVMETLDAIRAAGAIVVAHTDAGVGNSIFRLRSLDLIAKIDRLYAPEQPSTTLQWDYSEFTASGFLRMLPKSDRKPNPQLVIDILKDYGVGRDAALYVGDSLVRDMYMAKKAGVHAAWAHYGTIYERGLWEQLVKVSHWTVADVSREQDLKREAKSCQADVELRSFADLLGYFEFVGSTCP